MSLPTYMYTYVLPFYLDILSRLDYIFAVVDSGSDTCTFHVFDFHLRRRAICSWRVCEAPRVDMVDLERAGCSKICVFECIVYIYRYHRSTDGY